MAKKYKVVSITVGGAHNKIFNSGDIVTEDQFPMGQAEAYVKSGHLKSESTKMSAEEKVDAIKAAKTLDEVKELLEGDSRKSVEKAGVTRTEELESENANAEEAKVIEAIGAMEAVKDLKRYLDGDYSDEVKEAAAGKVDDIYIGFISKLEDEKDLKLYLDGDYSDAVKEAAGKKVEELKSAN